MYLLQIISVQTFYSLDIHMGLLNMKNHIKGRPLSDDYQENNWNIIILCKIASICFAAFTVRWLLLILNLVLTPLIFHQMMQVRPRFFILLFQDTVGAWTNG